MRRRDVSTIVGGLVILLVIGLWMMASMQQLSAIEDKVFGQMPNRITHGDVPMMRPASKPRHKGDAR